MRLDELGLTEGMSGFKTKNQWLPLPSGRWVDIYYYGDGHMAYTHKYMFFMHKYKNDSSIREELGPFEPLQAQCVLYELLGGNK